MENAMQFRKAVEGKVAHQKKAATIAFFILLVCWTPALIAGFPGYFTFDSGLGWLEQWGAVFNGKFKCAPSRSAYVICWLFDKCRASSV